MEPDDELTQRVLSLLESLRIPESEEEIAGWFAATQSSDAPSEDAESLLEEIDQSPEAMMRVALGVIGRADERDLANAGIVLLGPLLLARPFDLQDAFERQIRVSDAFRTAFARVSMTGVPLEIQQRLNTALLESGADPRLVVEYEDGSEEQL